MKNTIKLSIVFRSIFLLRSHVAAFLSRKNILETVLKKYVLINPSIVKPLDNVAPPITIKPVA